MTDDSNHEPERRPVPKATASAAAFAGITDATPGQAFGVLVDAYSARGSYTTSFEEVGK